MEVLGNNSTAKESTTTQDTQSNFSCRLPRDSNPNQRPRNETDVGLLVACKIQLSSEVIRWKTETLRLQKERDSAQSQAKDLNQKISKLAERTKELEARLLQAEEENKHLKTRSNVIDEEKAVLVHKLSQSVNKYHSYPWSETSPKSQRVSRLQASDARRCEDTPSEDWREVSQNMLQRMKQEMKELQEMSLQFSNDDKENPSASQKDFKDEVQESILGLVSETESLKHHLLEQRQKLQSLLAELSSSEPIERGHTNTRKDSATPNSELQHPIPKPKPSHSRLQPSKSPVYLTKQLETLDDLNKALKETQPSTNIQQPTQREPKHNSRQPSNPPTPKREEGARDEKVCPICQVSFDAAFPQALFEDHVMNHLETESTSLLDQYVVL